MRFVRRSRATSAAALATSRSCKQSSWQPSVCMPDFSVIGKPFPRVDGGAKVTGQAVYADDVVLPRTLHCKFLRSPHPHARIVSIDTSAARRISGVKAVITGADLPVKFGILPVTQDERALEHEKVRYVGDPIAAVAAIDEEIAAAACDSITVE